MKHQLSEFEARVIGCLMEKQVTTPEQYPLSLNGVTTACNQKSNREPVLEMSESEVQQTLDFLSKKRLIRSTSGGRTLKYEHRFCNSEFGNLKYSPAEFAVVTTLLLRGAQTPGELRSRTNRLHEFSDVSEVEEVLSGLSTREDGPFVVRLAREPGKRESRYQHLFSGEVSVDAEPVLSLNSLSLEARVTELEARNGELNAQLAELQRQLEALLARISETYPEVDE